MKFVVQMKWIEARNEWHMETLDGNILQEFFHCENIPRIFLDIDKNKLNKYLISVTNLTTEKE
jgi:hypothetical protein